MPVSDRDSPLITVPIGHATGTRFWWQHAASDVNRPGPQERQRLRAGSGDTTISDVRDCSEHFLIRNAPAVGEFIHDVRGRSAHSLA